MDSWSSRHSSPRAALNREQRTWSAGLVGAAVTWMWVASFAVGQPTLKPSPAPSEDFLAADDTGQILSSVPILGSLDHDGLTRTFMYYAPFNLPPAPIPVIVVLHGGGGNALSAIYRLYEGRWNELADIHKFIVLYPEGRPDAAQQALHYWNDCRSDVTDPMRLSTEDDVGFIEALVDWAAAKYAIDSNRVYVTGASNGGLMTYRLAYEATARFAAVASVIANRALNNECGNPSFSIPILIMTGTADPIMPSAGGCVGACSGGQVIGIDDTIAYWKNVNQTVSGPVIVNLPDVNTDDASTVTVLTYTNNLGDAMVVHYRINNGGHDVPGYDDPLPTGLLTGNKNRDISSADEIWSFFLQH